MLDLLKIRAFAAAGGQVTESDDVLSLVGRFPSEEDYHYWTQLRPNDVPAASISVIDPDLNAPVEEFVAEDQIRIVIKKTVYARAKFYFLAAQAKAVLVKRNTDFQSIFIADITAQQCFTTRGFQVNVWDQATAYDEAAETVVATTSTVTPGKFVRDYIQDRELTDTLEAWLITTEPAEASDFFVAWQQNAKRRVLGTIVNIITTEQNTIVFEVITPGLFKLALPQVAASECSAELANCARWIYFEGLDVEARHLIFTNELSRFGSIHSNLKTLLASAFGAAKVAYDAHVRSSSRETMKALAELRKTALDEAQKASQKAQDLTSGIWRETAVFVTPFTLKALLNDYHNPLLTAGSFFLGAILIAISGWLQNSANERFFETQESSRVKWVAAISAYFSEDDKKSILEAPMQGVRKNFNRVRCVVYSVYFVYFAVLTAIGVATLFSKHIVDAEKLILVLRPLMTANG